VIAKLDIYFLNEGTCPRGTLAGLIPEACFERAEKLKSGGEQGKRVCGEPREEGPKKVRNQTKGTLAVMELMEPIAKRIVSRSVRSGC
jgi:hypothetical protein